MTTKNKEFSEPTIFDIEEESIRKNNFKDIIGHSLNLIFCELEKTKKDFDIWKNQDLILKYEITKNQEEINVLELVSKSKLEKKATDYFLETMKLLQDRKYSCGYSSILFPDFYATIEFSFKNKVENYYPVVIDLKFENIPEDGEKRRFLLLDIPSNCTNQTLINSPDYLLNKSKKGSYKQSGHYVDMKLKHNYGLDKKGIIDNLTESRIKNMLKDEVVVSGIKVEVSEDRLLNSILKLLHNKSDIREGSENYYKGNMPSQKNMYAGKVVDYPVLNFSPSELYKEYTGTKNYSGAEAKYIKETLLRLQDKKYLIIYKRHKFDEKGNKTIDRIEEYQPLIKVITYYENISSEEDLKLDKGESISDEKGKIVVCLNPIFIDQIDTKFIEYPSGINQKTIIACGGAKRVTDSIIRMRDYLLREQSNKHFITEINEEKLGYILGLDSYIKQKRKGMIKKSIDKAIEFAFNFGILKKVETIDGSEGQNKFRFILNTEF